MTRFQFIRGIVQLQNNPTTTEKFCWVLEHLKAMFGGTVKNAEITIQYCYLIQFLSKRTISKEINTPSIL